MSYLFPIPKGWVVPDGYNNEMTVSGTIYNGLEFANEGDWIAVFGPDLDIRAVGRVGANGSYDLTVAGNTDGEDISFQLLNCVEDEILESLETVEFITDGETTDKVIHVGMLTQEIDLITGWNWVSFNVLPKDISLEDFFDGVDPNSIEQVKTQYKSAIHTQDGWIGEDPNTLMSNISNGAMFKIKAKTGFTLSVTGIPLPSDLPVTLAQGWTWIAYIPQECMGVADWTGPIFPNFIQVKSQIQSKTKKVSNCTLIGDLQEMCPGTGYVVKMDFTNTTCNP